MDFDLVLRSRHSVRVFSEKPVTRDILRKIVEDAGRAPSWVNAQEWHVYMATEKTLKNIRAEYMALAEKGDQGMTMYRFLPPCLSPNMDSMNIIPTRGKISKAILN